MVKKATNTTSSDVDQIIEVAKGLLQTILVEKGVPESHGYGHALAVLGHLQKALKSAESTSKAIDDSRSLAC